MDDLDIAVSLAFRVLLQKSGKGQKEVASEIGLSETGISKVLNFRQGVTFLQAHLFCVSSGLDISEMSKLVVKISQDKDLLKSIRECQKTKKQITASMKNLLGNV